MIETLERRQVPIYLAAIACGALLGAPWAESRPALASVLAAIVDPALVALLYVTFLGVPFTRLTRVAKDGRFLGALALLNGVVAPLVALVLTWLAHEALGMPAAFVPAVLLVLLAPCVDYVLVFTRLAGGDEERLLAASPLLMLGQMVLVPAVLLAVAGPTAISLTPFVRAFLVFVALPLTLAVLTQALAAHHRWARRFADATSSTMVPLMALVLASVVGSQAHLVAHLAGQLALLVPLYAAFAAVMVVLGAGVGRLARADAGARRALMFSGVTRNSLVVLPLARALSFDGAPAVVVTQTLVELIAMVVLVRLVPRFVQDPDTPVAGVGGTAGSRGGDAGERVTGR